MYMGYIFGILKKTKTGIEKTTHFANTNHQAHVSRSRLVREEGIIAATPIMKNDMHNFKNTELPLVFNAIIKKAKPQERGES